MRGAPRLGSPPPTGRSAPALPSTVSSYQSVFSPSRSNSSTVENQRDASERPSQGSRARETASRHPETTGEYPEDFVNRSHRVSGMLALQHSRPLLESEIFQEQASMRSKAAGE